MATYFSNNEQVTFTTLGSWVTSAAFQLVGEDAFFDDADLWLYREAMTTRCKATLLADDLLQLVLAEILELDTSISCSQKLFLSLQFAS
jgi:hypothetical protein